jgi:hypothetical protein
VHALFFFRFIPVFPPLIHPARRFGPSGFPRNSEKASFGLSINRKDMTRQLIFLLATLVTQALMAQIKGRITDAKGEPLVGVNVFIKGTYDGGTTDVNGRFAFDTDETGEQILVASFVGFKTYEQTIQVSTLVQLEIQLKEEVSMLTGITITAGAFEASDEKKAVVLKPLDIAMTAGATADIAGALNTLPGTTTNGESGRLFVRGGTANETQAFVDGVLVQNFYSATPNNLPARTRFSPFLFKGTFFSTGGYSAEYGEALSSVLSLTSQDIADETRTDISLMTVGADVAHTEKYTNGSVFGQIQYVNLNPYNNIIKQNYDWDKAPTSGNGTFMLRQKLSKNDMLKVYINHDQSAFIVNMPDINSANSQRVDMVNKNSYINTSYQRAIGNKSTWYMGTAFGRMREEIDLDDTDVETTQNSFHVKSYFTSDLQRVTLKTGGEIIGVKHAEIAAIGSDVFHSNFNSQIIAFFGETDFYITNQLTLRSGLRYTHYTLMNAGALAPRVSMAVKTGEYSQISGAYGQFQQLPGTDILIRSQEINYERADHYMVSYQRIKNRQTFRGEVYYKGYQDLVKFDAADRFNPLAYNNSGSGSAKGVDIFWRDAKTIKYGDYWLSYSFIDTERNFRDYPEMATPNFAAKHNFAAVYKHFIPKLKTQIGASFTWNSGRPYENPNKEGFNESRTKDFSDLSFNFAYLPKQNIIIYSSLTNLLGRVNEFGYQFANTPNGQGEFESRAIGQPAKRFAFIGVFITLTKDQSKNNLENL